MGIRHWMWPGCPVQLDLRERMIHNFQDRVHAPEAILARHKMRAFLQQHLGM
jgi:hypothetical protein